MPHCLLSDSTCFTQTRSMGWKGGAVAIKIICNVLRWPMRLHYSITVAPKTARPWLLIFNLLWINHKGRSALPLYLDRVNLSLMLVHCSLHFRIVLRIFLDRGYIVMHTLVILCFLRVEFEIVSALCIANGKAAAHVEGGSAYLFSGILLLNERLLGLLSWPMVLSKSKQVLCRTHSRIVAFVADWREVIKILDSSVVGCTLIKRWLLILCSHYTIGHSVFDALMQLMYFGLFLLHWIFIKVLLEMLFISLTDWVLHGLWGLCIISVYFHVLAEFRNVMFFCIDEIMTFMEFHVFLEVVLNCS